VIYTSSSRLIIGVGWGDQLHIILILQSKVLVGSSRKHFLKPQIINLKDNFALLGVVLENSIGWLLVPKPRLMSHAY
jgi:hypothetical protein